MPPGWVDTLEDYWRWLEQLIDSSGGYTEQPFVVQPIDGELGEIVGLTVPRQRVYFYDETYLEVWLNLEEDLSSTDYVFTYVDLRAGGAVWGKHNHPGHESDVGRYHLHPDPFDQDRREPFVEVDFEEALHQVFQAKGWTEATPSQSP